MKINYIITTIAMKIRDTKHDEKTGYIDVYHYCIDTYVRINVCDNDKQFIDSFMREYAGNGIEKVTIIDKQSGCVDVDTFTELENIFEIITRDYEDVNTTILNY